MLSVFIAMLLHRGYVLGKILYIVGFLRYRITATYIYTINLYSTCIPLRTALAIIAYRVFIAFIVCLHAPTQDEAEAEAGAEAEVGDEVEVYHLILDRELLDRRGPMPEVLGLFPFSQRRQHRITPSGGFGLLRLGLL